MAKMARERALQERRQRKQEKKEERKQAAADARNANAGEIEGATAPPEQNGSGQTGD